MNPSHVLLLVPEITKGMKSIGSKALLQLNKHQTIIDYQIQYIKKFYRGSRIVVLTGFEHDKIKNQIKSYSNTELVFNANYEQTNQGASILHYLKAYSPNNCLIINNGVLLKEKLHIQSNSDSTIFVLKSNKSGFNIGINDLDTKEDGYVSYMFYSLPTQWSECVFLNNEAIETIVDMSSKFKIGNLFLFELLNKLLEKNIGIKATAINKKNIFKINIAEDAIRTKNFYDKNLFSKAK